MNPTLEDLQKYAQSKIDSKDPLVYEIALVTGADLAEVIDDAGFLVMVMRRIANNNPKYYHLEEVWRVKRLQPLELAELSTDWENPTVDTKKYIQVVTQAFESTKELYELWKRLGMICQEYNGKYYIT